MKSRTRRPSLSSSCRMIHERGSEMDKMQENIILGLNNMTAIGIVYIKNGQETEKNEERTFQK